MAVLPFIGPTYRSQSPTADAEECTNWYVEAMETKDATTAAALYPRPGVLSFCQLPTFPVRALFSMAGRCFAVGGEVFYEITLDPEADWPASDQPSGTAINYGVIATDNHPATISSNGDGGGQLFIASAGSGYVFDLTANTLTFVVAGANQGAFLGGYFIRLDTASSTFGLSALNDGTTWDGTQTAQRSLAADPWVTMAVIHNELWLLGSQTSEVWQNTGAASFPFEPIPGAFLQYGCGAPDTLARLGTSLAWLGANEQGQSVVYRSSGYQPVRASNHAVEYALQSVADQSTADAFAYQDQGHEFYVLNCPALDQTWVLDTATNLWHRRDYWNTETALSEIARPRSHAMAFGYHLVGDRVTGDILVQDINYTYDTGGVAIRRVRTAPHLTDELKWAAYRRVEMNMQVGQGLTLPSAYYATLLASGATHYFRFGETLPGIGTTFRDSIGSASGSGTVTVGQPSMVADSNASITFDGTESIVLSAATATTTTFWMEFLFQPDNTQLDVNGYIFYGAAGFNSAALAYTAGTGRLIWIVNGVSAGSYSYVFTSGEIYHIVVSVAAGVATMYVDGTAVSNTISGIISTTPDRLGSQTSLANFYKGGLDEFSYAVGSTMSAATAAAHYYATGAVSAAPQVMLQYSDDDAHTWSRERWVSAGLEGRYSQRVIWRQLGRSRDRIFRVVCSDGVPWRLTSFYGEIDRGTGA